VEVELRLNVKQAIPGGPVLLFTKLTMHPTLAGYPLGPITKREIRDLYYDTEDGALARAGVGLRSRIMDGVPYLTLKKSKFQDGALVGREEFEEPLVQERVDWTLSHIKDLIGEGPFSAEAFFTGKPCGALVPVLEVGTARLIRPVGPVAQLTLDMVEYPGISAHPYFDIEVEARSGKTGERILRGIETELYALAEGHLAPATASKLERGLRLKQKIAMK
jgi:inorganic triphosphatase YgiF